MARRYPPEAHEFILANYKGSSHAELAEATNRVCGTTFTPQTMSAYLAKRKLRTESSHNPRKSRLFSLPVSEFICEHNEGVSATELTELINAAFKTAYTVQQIKNYRARHHLTSGLTGYFKEGHTPHNKGKKTGSYPGMVQTQYKKGHLPHNYRPVGSVRVTCNGYLERKIADPKEWRMVHVLNWEAEYGPVPDGCVIIFRDGDKTNCDTSNLLLVTRAELARMNQKGLISSDGECTEAGLNVARLIIATNKRKKQMQKNKE